MKMPRFAGAIQRKSHQKRSNDSALRPLLAGE
jgi:hypothetical protein